MSNSWIDDLTACSQSCAENRHNLVYHTSSNLDDEEGEMFQNKSFNIQFSDETQLYGLIDGHYGCHVAELAQLLLAELGLEPFSEDDEDDVVIKRLKQAFENAKKGHDDSISPSLVKKMTLDGTIEGMDKSEVEQTYPKLIKQLEELKSDLAGGCSIVLALVLSDRLYIGNIGDSRALLCRSDEHGELGVVQLSTEHTIDTVSELQRLANIGLDIELLQKKCILRTTRSIGDWPYKGGYKTNPDLCAACEEPVLSMPSIHGGEQINDTMKFIVLMSHGIYTAYLQATQTSPDQVNHEIALMVHDAIERHATLDKAVEHVVDTICQLHREKYVSSHNTQCLKREDMTLLVRMFNAKLATRLAKPNVKAPSAFKNKLAIVNLPIIIPNQQQPVVSTEANNSSTTTTPSTTTPGSSATNSPAFSKSLPSSPLSLEVTSKLSGLTINIEEEEATPVTPPPDVQRYLEDMEKLRGDTSLLQTNDPVKTPTNVVYPTDVVDYNNGREYDESSEQRTLHSDDTGTSTGSSIQSEAPDIERPVPPYVDFNDFLANISKAGGEEAVFPELFVF